MARLECGGRLPEALIFLGSSHLDVRRVRERGGDVLRPGVVWVDTLDAGSVDAIRCTLPDEAWALRALQRLLLSRRAGAQRSARRDN
eukprot:scaffold15627_cov124-Isochrysis_galbana.AAC.1